MSSDMMPCGCAGHLDNIDLCRYPALRQRVAQLEAALERQHQNAANWAVKQGEQRARAEQAEKERDAARALLRVTAEACRGLGPVTPEVEAVVGQALTARERAEADNATFREDSRRGMLLWHGSHCEMSGGAYPENPSECVDRQCRTWAARLAADHPGAALLGRVLALEAWVKEVETLVGGWGHADECPAGVDDESAGPCECVNGEMQALLDKADALKERKP